MDTWFPTFRRFARTRGSFSTWWPRYTTDGQRQSLLRLIRVATDDHLPLSRLIESWAEDERGIQVRRLRLLARLLKGGTPLPDAVEEIPGLLRDEDVLAIRFGAQSGTLSTAIRDMLDESKPAPLSRPSRIRKTVIYFCVVLLLGFAIVAFIQIWITPTLNQILVGFSLEHTQILQWSMQLSRFIANFWWLGALVVLALLWSTFSARPGRFIRHAILGRLFRPLREQRAADMLMKLSSAMHAGRPITGALSTLARYHYDPTLRHKLLFVRNEVEQGADVWQSMTAVDLLTMPEVHLLKTAERIGNQPWALQQLAFARKRRRRRSLERISEFLLPTLAVLTGLFVLFQALTVFLPLTKLIQSLS